MAIQRVGFIILLVAVSSLGRSQVVFSNDFETDTTGFGSSGTLGGLTRVSLPTDSGGMSSPNQSMWLGRLGYNVAKSSAGDEIVTLLLAGLVPGNQYFVSFDLFIGASWDGAASSYGPDSWRFSVDGVRLVDTIFANGAQGINLGAYSPQRYTDTSFTSPNGPDVPRFSGADAFWSANQSGNYGNDYAIYAFGHGTGNPTLAFTVAGATATLVFARYGNTTDSADEYWALDNVQVIAVPEPGAGALLGIGLSVLAILRGRRSGPSPGSRGGRNTAEENASGLVPR